MTSISNTRIVALKAGVAAIALVFAGAAVADPAAPASPDASSADTATPAADDIIVTGIRASLDASAKLKRLSPTITETVSAEDIGKLPDVSIADSLARLPGVTAQRLEGRDQRLSIRGLGPDFSTTLLNGREQVTVGDNRGVEYDQYPSEFFKNVVVHKSADPSIIPNGIAGTVDLHMLRPLDTTKRVIAVQARGEVNGQKSLNPDSSNKGYRASATYVDQFADDTFGVAIGVSASLIPSQDERYNAWGYATDPKGNLVLGGGKPYVQSNELKRYGAVATFEWHPSDKFHSTLDLLYSHFEETQHLRGIEFPLGFSGAPQSGYVTSNGFDTTTVFSNVHAIQRNDINIRKADNFSAGWNNKIELSDKVRLTVDASYSYAKRTDFLLETYSGFGYNGAGPGDTVTVTQQPNGIFKIVPTLDYTNTNLVRITDPGGWGYNGTTAVVQSGFLNKPQFKDDLKALRASLDGDFDYGALKGWEVGANFTTRKKTSNFLSYFLCPPGGGTKCTVASGTPTSAAIPAGAILGHNVPLAYLGVPAVLGLNPLFLYNNFLNSAYDNRPVSLVRDNDVKEDVLTGYALLKLDGAVGGVPLTGNIGGQVVYTDQRSDGSISNFSNGVVTVVPATGSTRYTYFLPSAALSFEVAPLTYIKAGGARTLVRARLDQERVNQEFNINLSHLGSTDPANSVFSSSGGNVNLRPYISDNADLSFEKYFTKGGYFALAGYYKHLSSYVDANSSILFDFKSAVPSSLTPTQAAAVGTTLGLVSAPTNRGNGDLKGFEATISLPLSNLTTALTGFGVFGSGSYTDSSIKLGSNPTKAITLPGLSKWVANAEVYYERAGFQARVSYRYRSSYLGEVAGLSANPTFRQVTAEGILDAQIGYEFQPGTALAGLSVLLQAKNLTDRPFITYQNNDKRQVIDYQRYGRDYYVGLAYKF
jgi:iron complex outermembrane receptor protein